MSKARLESRNRAERRFRLYGKLAVTLALGFLALLLFTVASRGWQGFLHTEIRLHVAVTPSDPGNDPQHADLSPAIKRSLMERFPGEAVRKRLRELTGLVSSGAPYLVHSAMLAQPGQAELTLWLPASDAVDRAVKTHATQTTPPLERKITDRQLGWLDALRQSGDVRTGWNDYFFRYGDSREPEQAGFMGSMVGSFFTLLSCMLLAFPVGVMAAIYLEEFARKTRLTGWIEININNLAAVPSIVFGLLGLEIFINVAGIPRSASLAGGLTLALMILPTIIITTRASLRAIPDSIRDAARGLGASPLQVVLHHTLPLSVPGIMTGTILGLARAMGETAPLLMIGMVAFIADVPRGPLDAATAMPVQIYLWATSPEQSFVEKTAAGIMVLVIVLILMNSLAIFLRKRFERHW